MRVFFRVDAGQEIGSGHFMRCRLLARALRRQGVASSFVTATPANDLFCELQDEGFPVLQLPKEAAVDAESIIRIIESQGEKEALVVVDDHRKGFHTLDFQHDIRRAGFKLMMISFRHEFHFAADVVHNQNLLALEHDYSAEDYTQLLLGPRYAVLDDAFRRLRPEQATVPRHARVVLVTFGGADRTDQTSKVIDALSALDAPPQRVIVVAGGLYAHASRLRNFLNDRTQLNAELHVNTPNMPELMAASDLAVSSGGLTAWELACLGVPNAILSTAEAERQTGRLLSHSGYAHYLGHHDEVSKSDVAQSLEALLADESRRRRLAVRSRQLVDGRGTHRVVGHVKALALPSRNYA